MPTLQHIVNGISQVERAAGHAVCLFVRKLHRLCGGKACLLQRSQQDHQDHQPAGIRYHSLAALKCTNIASHHFPSYLFAGHPGRSWHWRHARRCTVKALPACRRAAPLLGGLLYTMPAPHMYTVNVLAFKQKRALPGAAGRLP